jgi:hypothetical protein
MVNVLQAPFAAWFFCLMMGAGSSLEKMSLIFHLSSAKLDFTGAGT